ncbi:MAG: beta-galactosidase, partial [Clostridia bacterium]|nr:beta-galactosidase [Clostridia bacterium]
MMAIPRPEHPRPQFVRDAWMNLNGEWDFQFDFGNSGRYRALWKSENFMNGETRKITVPFCPESRLSGIGYTDWIAAVWYRRTFDLTKEQLDGRVILHFGAVDYHSIIYVNEYKVGEHTGGYSSFELDITKAVKEGENLIIVYAEDNNRTEKQPYGKQSLRYESSGCSFTRTTGFWQTV